MKKTMKKRAFVSAIAMLIVSAIVLTSSTFAWFSMARQVEVETMQLNVTSPDGVQVSCNPDSFTTSLTVKEILGTSEPSRQRFAAYTGNVNHIPDFLMPSSSPFDTRSGSFPAFFTGSIDENNKLSTRGATDAAGGYVVFDLFIKVASQTTLYFKNSTVTSDDVPELPYAARIGIAYCGVNTLKAADLVTDALTQWKPARAKSTVYCVDSVNHLPDNADITDKNYIFCKAGANLTPDAGTKVFTTDAYFVQPAADYSNYTLSTGNPSVTCGAGVSRLRVYMWIEGNDIDCTNDISGASVNFSLVLSMDA